ncbi:MAG: PA domain-containing protein, partial [Vicinamibacterales bacterium]
MSRILSRLAALAAVAVLLAFVATTTSDAQSGAFSVDPYRADADRLIAAAQADHFAWERLAELTDTYGNRFSGSENLNRAIAWAVAAMKADGLENVHTEKVMVPRWIRGKESAVIVEPAEHPVVMLGLGGSVATPPGGVEAEVMVVTSFDELTARAADAKGKIVLFDVPYTTYGQTNRYRTGGASAAARVGAVAALVRSVGPVGLRTPHTGQMNYADDAPKIPTAAITAEDANRIHRIVGRGQTVRLRLSMEAHMEPNVESANVVGEIRGREKADEVVLV